MGAERYKITTYFMELICDSCEKKHVFTSENRDALSRLAKIERWVVGNNSLPTSCPDHRAYADGRPSFYDPQRANEMYNLRKTGKTMREIGIIYGITHERVRQIIKKKTQTMKWGPQTDKAQQD